MKQVEYFKGDGENTVFSTKLSFLDNNMQVEKLHNTNGEVVRILNYTKLSENTILLEEVVSNDYTIKIEYNTIETSEDSREDLLKRIVKLEEAVKNLNSINQALEAAVNNRVNTTAFKAWLRLVEKKTGITLIDDKQAINYIGAELSK